MGNYNEGNKNDIIKLFNRIKMLSKVFKIYK